MSSPFFSTFTLKLQGKVFSRIRRAEKQDSKLLNLFFTLPRLLFLEFLLKNKDITKQYSEFDI